MMVIDPYEVLYFVSFGTFGAILYVITQAKSWEDFKKFEYKKHILLGPFIGFLYQCLYSEYNFPNTIMAIVAGYAGTNFVTWVMGMLSEHLKKDVEEDE
jgi:hypothetical protein